MKLTILRGIAHDLVNHLDFIFSHQFSFLPLPIDTNCFEEKDDFDNYCSTFFKERLPKNLDLARIKAVNIKIGSPNPQLSISVTVYVDQKKFSIQN